MANQLLQQFSYSFSRMLTEVEVKIPIGASGAVGTLVGQGITSVTKLTTGIYAIKLNDNYSKFIHALYSIESPTAGAAVTAGSFVTGTMYQITTLGNTNYNSAGLNTNFTAAVGMTFVATGAGAGTGTATAVTDSNIYKCELMPSPDSMLQPTTGKGSLFILQTLGPTATADTALIPTEPLTGSVLRVRLLLSNSSVVPQY